METSILTSTKKILGIPEDHTEFDLDVITHINSVFSDLTQLGIGPDGGFSIEDASVDWVEYLGDDQELSNVKTYMYLRVRLLFDPPTTSYLLAAAEKQIEKFEFRLNITREGRDWQDPTPPSPPEEDVFA